MSLLNRHNTILLFAALAGLALLALACGGGESARGRSAQAWAGELRKGDSARRAEAARALGTIAREAWHSGRPVSPDITQALTGALRDRRPPVRLAAALALAWTSEPPPASALVLMDALRDRGLRTARERGDLLLRTATPQAETSLAYLLQIQGSPAAATAPLGLASDAATTSGAARRAAAEAALQRLADPQPDARKEAALALGRMGPEADAATAALIKRAQTDPQPSVRGVACWALTRAGRPGVDTPWVLLILHQKTSDPAVAMAAAYAAYRVSPPTTQALLELAASLKNPDEGVRAAAALALGEFGPGAQRPDEALLEVAPLKDVLWPQTQAGRVIEPLIPLMQAALGDPAARVRAAAAVTLGRICPERDDVMADLVRRLADPDAQVRRAAAWALGRLAAGRPKVARALFKAMKDEDPAVRAAAAVALGKIAPTAGNGDDQALVAALDPALGDAQPIVRAAAARALARLGLAVPVLSERLPGRLTDLLRDGSPEVRAAAALALGQATSGPPEVVGALAKALADPGGKVRAAAALALGWFGAQARPAIPALEKLLREDPSARLEAALALAWIGSLKAGPVAVITAALADPETWRAQDARVTAPWLDPADPASFADPDRAMQYLESAADRPDLAREALLALGWLGPRAAEAVPTLIGLMKNMANPLPIRLAAATALIAIGPEQKTASVPPLFRLAREQAEEERTQAAVALAFLGKAAGPAAADLAAALRDAGNPARVRIAAAGALARLAAADVQTSFSVTALREVADAAGETRVKAAAVRALAALSAAPVAPSPASLIPVEK